MFTVERVKVGSKFISEMEGSLPGSEANAEEAPDFKEAKRIRIVRGGIGSRKRTHFQLCAFALP